MAAFRKIYRMPHLRSSKPTDEQLLYNAQFVGDTRTEQQLRWKMRLHPRPRASITLVMEKNSPADAQVGS